MLQQLLKTVIFSIFLVPSWKIEIFGSLFTLDQHFGFIIQGIRTEF